jgi:hypothetical protein
VTRIISITRISGPSRRWTLHMPRWLGALAWHFLFAGTKFVNRVIPGYTQPVGAKYELIVDHDGPASYNNTGTFATSGEVLNASDFGFGGFETVDPQGLSSDGLNYVWIQLPNQSTSADNIGNAVPTCRIHWYVAATNAEVANTVNLAGKSIRLQIRAV